MHKTSCNLSLGGSCCCCSASRERRGCGEAAEESCLPYNRRVALSDSDVVGGPLHIHTPDGESCGDKTKQSEKRSL